MKNKFLQMFIIPILCAIPFLSNVQNFTVSDYIGIAQVEEASITPYADVIVTQYRSYNGVLQYRRWNKTRACWVDPDWIDMP